MLIPIRHENMKARRWPVITLGLIAVNVIAFVLTTGRIADQSRALGQVKLRVLMLAATHPELKMPADVQQFVTTFRDHNPTAWKELQNPNTELTHLAGDDGAAFKTQVLEDVNPWQARMDSLAREYTEVVSGSVTENYAFIPAHPTWMSYITANFLHGGWLHLIGNMWFLWLAGFVLEDAWGRPLYSVVYLIAGAVALEIHALANAGSLVPTLGASGAVAALMGAFRLRAASAVAADGGFLRFAVRHFHRRGALGTRGWVRLRHARRRGSALHLPGAKGEQGHRRGGQLAGRTGDPAGE